MALDSDLPADIDLPEEENLRLDDGTPLPPELAELPVSTQLFSKQGAVVVPGRRLPPAPPPYPAELPVRMQFFSVLAVTPPPYP